MLIELAPSWYATVTNPLNPGAGYSEWVMQGRPAWWLSLMWWIGYANFIVIAANVLPVYPLDGAHALESVLMAMFGRRRGRSASIAVALALCVVIVFASLLVSQVIGVFLGGFALMCCITAARRHSFIESQPVAQSSALPPPTPSLMPGDFDEVITRAPRSVSNLETSTFQVRVNAAPNAPQVVQARSGQSDRLATEEEVVDRILAKITTEGMAALTEQERKILESVTARRRRG